MSIKDKIKSAWKKVACKRSSSDKSDKTDCGCGCGKKRKCDCDNAELAAEEVIEKEIYPNKPIKKASVKPTGKSCTRKPASKRTRPTNVDYCMIDKDDNTCDSGKS